MKKIKNFLFISILASLALFLSFQQILAKDFKHTYLPLVQISKLPIIPFNLNFSPYKDGQDPNYGSNLSEKQILERLQIIKPYSKWVRSFGCGNGLESVGKLAHQLGLSVAVNAWINADTASNQKQIACLIQQANAGNVDLAIVGSEAILRGDVTPAVLIEYLDQVKTSIPTSIPVATADTYQTLLDTPAVIEHSDIIMANIYPFWEGYPVANAASVTNYLYQQLVSAYPQKPVYISEAGWPSCGSYHEAIGSPENEKLYLSQIISWAADHQVQLFYFNSFDEKWKITHEGPQGGCWGVFSSSGTIKTGLKPVLDGERASYDLSLPKTCNTETPSFSFTSVPPIGSYDNVTGKACGIFNKDYKVVMYIYVYGGWWIKPYANAPYTSIDPDGNWSVDYTTGGIDEQATIIKAYLLPKGVDAFSDLSAYPMIQIDR